MLASNVRRNIMKLARTINAALLASLLLVISGPINACEIPSKNSAQYSDTDSLPPGALLSLYNKILEE